MIDIYKIEQLVGKSKIDKAINDVVSKNDFVFYVYGDNCVMSILEIDALKKKYGEPQTLKLSEALNKFSIDDLIEAREKGSLILKKNNP